MADAKARQFRKLEAHLWGIIAEWLSYMLLVACAYTPLERRWRCPVGEIDLIAHKNDLLLFIEVKARPTYDKAAESVSVQQRIRIENAARSWIASHPKFTRHDVRFDVMIVTPWRLPVHLKDAWRPQRG